MMAWALSPLSWIFVGVLLLLAAIKSRRGRRASSVAAMLLLSAGYAATTPAVANRMVGMLETPPHALQDCKDNPPREIVVLGGGSGRQEIGSPAYSALSLSSRRRLERAYAEWMGGARQAGLILSGGLETPGNSLQEAAMMGDYAQAIGIPSSSIRMDTKAMTTWESGANIASMLGEGHRRIALVTSAWHMPRALYAFRAAGFQVCQVPCDSAQTPSSLPASLLPRSTALAKSELVLHELLGMAYYRYRATQGGHP